MIKIFDSLSKTFNTNGLIVIKPISCLEIKKKSLNGWYIETEVDSLFKEYIVKDNLIVVQTKSKLNPQAFRINEIEERAETIFVHADHVMFDADRYYIEDSRPTKMNALNALNYLNNRTDNPSPFSFSSDVSKIATQYVIDKSLLEAMELIEERWGGFYDADNFSIEFKETLGSNRGEVIRKKKNMISKVITEDWSNVVTKLYPKGPDGIKLPEKYLISDIQYQIPYTKSVDFDFDVDEEMDEQDIISTLRELATDYLEKNKYPLVCYEIEANIKNVEIGDKVQVIDKNLNILTEIQEYEYNLITKRIESIVFGNYTKDVKRRISNLKDSIQTIIETLSVQQAEIIHQTELINNLNKNGIVRITDNEILIVDRLPIKEAVNVWRFGLGGLGFSSHGYEGPFETAITIDGHINADFITTGNINTDLIEGYNELLLKVANTYDFTKTSAGVGEVTLENFRGGGFVDITITGNISLLYPSSKTYPSSNTFTKSTYLTVENSSGKKRVKIPIKRLRTLDGTFDELKIYSVYNDEKQQFEYHVRVIEKIGLDENSQKFVLGEPISKEYGIVDIPFENGNNKLYFKSFPGLSFSAKYLIINEVTNTFATNAYVNKQINFTENAIIQEVGIQFDGINEKVDGVNNDLNEKVTNANQNIENAEKRMRASLVLKLDKTDFTGDNLVSMINLAAYLINLDSNRLSWNSDFSSMTNDGHLTAQSGNFKNCTIDGGDLLLKNGAKVVGDNGLLTNLQFQSFGQYLGKSFVGFGVDYNTPGSSMSVVKTQLPVIVQIPENFTVVRAYVTINHSIIKNASLQIGYARKIKLYKANSLASPGIYTDGHGVSGWIDMAQISGTEIKGAFGANGFTASNTYSSSNEIKVSSDIGSSLNAGANILFIQTDETTSSTSSDMTDANSKTGAIQLTVDILGYLNFS